MLTNRRMLVLVLLVAGLALGLGPWQKWNDARRWRADEVRSARKGITEYREDPSCVEFAFYHVVEAVQDFGVKPEEFGSTQKEIDRLRHEFVLSECRQAVGIMDITGPEETAKTLSGYMVCPYQPLSLKELAWTMKDMASLQRKAHWTEAEMTTFRKSYRTRHPDEDFWFDGSRVEINAGWYIIYQPQGKRLVSGL